MRSAVSWCRQHRPALAEWINPDIFDRILATLAYVTPGADGGEGWAAQTAFLKDEIGHAYMKNLAARLDEYIRAL